MYKTLLASALALTLSGATIAAPQPVTIDESHTRILFFINHLGYSEMYGDFSDFDIELALDAEDHSQSTVKATIRADSVDMRHDGLNKHLKNEDFFNVEEHPEITFESVSVKSIGENRLMVHGNVTLLGVARPAALDVTINNIGEHPMSKKPWAGFTATTTLKRSDFGMGYALPAVGDEVRLQIGLEGSPGGE
jgi:polyisoprenoid-binding protein YceI